MACFCIRDVNALLGGLHGNGGRLKLVGQGWQCQDLLSVLGGH